MIADPARKGHDDAFLPRASEAGNRSGPVHLVHVLWYERDPHARPPTHYTPNAGSGGRAEHCAERRSLGVGRASHRRR